MTQKSFWPSDLLLGRSHGCFAELNVPRRKLHVAESPLHEALIDSLYRWLPPPIEVFVEGKRSSTHVDCAIVDYRCKTKMIAEADGFEYHSSKRQFVADRRRDVHALLDGWPTMRFTAADLFSDPDICGAQAAQYMLKAWVLDDPGVMQRTLHEENARVLRVWESWQRAVWKYPGADSLDAHRVRRVASLEMKRFGEYVLAPSVKLIWCRLWHHWAAPHSSIFEANLAAQLAEASKKYGIAI